MDFVREIHEQDQDIMDSRVVERVPGVHAMRGSRSGIVHAEIAQFALMLQRIRNRDRAFCDAVEHAGVRRRSLAHVNQCG